MQWAMKKLEAEALVRKFKWGLRFKKTASPFAQLYLIYTTIKG